MEKSIQMEQDLSEEQLQDITGACAQCDADTDAARNSLNMANDRLNAALKAPKEDGPHGRVSLLNQADTYHKTAKNLLKEIDARHQPPGLDSTLAPPNPR